MDSRKSRDGWDRWACLAAAMVMEACGGLGYTFGVYSQHLKERLDYGQEALDGIGAAKDIGYCLGIVGGIVYNFIPPWLTVCIGGVLHFMGYFMVYMTSAGKVEPSFIMICGFIAAGTGGDSWIDTAAIMTSVQNFADYRGTALGVLKAQVGLSGAIFVTLYKAFLKPNVDGYVLMVALAPAVTSILLAVFIRPFPLKDSSDSSGEGRFKVAYGATIFLGVYLLFTIFFQAWKDATKSWLIFFAVTMLIQFVLICSILALYRPVKRLLDYMIGGMPTHAYSSQEMVAKPSLKSKTSNINSDNIRLEDDNQPLRDEVSESQDDSQGHMMSSPSQLPQKQGYNVLEQVSDEASMGTEPVSRQGLSEELAEIERYTLWDCLRSINFWIFCLVAITGPGTGLTVINNFGQMGRALLSESTELFVGLISVASCFGRLIAGYGSDVMLKSTPYPRPMFLTFAHITMSLGCLILSAGYVPLLYLGSILVGGSYGAFWAVSPAIIAEIFGLQNFAALYKIVGACGPVGAYVLSAKLVGQFYDEEAELNYRSGMPHDAGDGFGDENTCLGPKCFGFSMLILAVVCILASSLGIFMSIRTKRLYQQLRLIS